MTDVIDRMSVPKRVVLEPDRFASKVRVPFSLSEPGRLLIAAASASAGVIHFVMVPSHMGEWAPEGVAFALTGWFQLIVAYLAIRRSSRPLLVMALVANLAFIGAWAVTRTAGAAWGPHAGHAELVSSVDLACVALEGAVAVLALLFLTRPRLASGWRNGGPLLAPVVPLAILALTTFVIASPGARNHSHESHGGHAAGVHDHGGTTGHDHADDRGFSALSNGHHHGLSAPAALDLGTQARLDEQLAVTRQVAARYPTVADVEAAGYTRAGPYAPGIGAHYINYAGGLNPDGVVNRDDLEHPLAIIYDGTDPTSKVAGFMYYSMSPQEPAGFVGPNDTWHYHENICLKTGPGGVIEAPYGADQEATPAQCAAAGGYILPVTQWMTHVWTVPGYENDEQGVFAEATPALDCSDGSYYVLPVDDWADHPLDVCKTQAI